MLADNMMSPKNMVARFVSTLCQAVSCSVQGAESCQLVEADGLEHCLNVNNSDNCSLQSAGGLNGVHHHSQLHLVDHAGVLPAIPCLHVQRAHEPGPNGLARRIDVRQNSASSDDNIPSRKTGTVLNLLQLVYDVDES